jgi:nucleotide-binding universal stress UspA family protein
MGIKSILVPVDGGPESFAALEQAFVIAQAFGAHVDALHVMQRVSDGASQGLYNLSARLRKDLEVETEKVALEKASELSERFQDMCRQHGIAIKERPSDDTGPTACWQQKFGRINEVLVAHGRVCDVITVRRPGLKAETIRRSPLGENIEAILMATARPVLLVPPEFQAKRCERAAIGWNESAEASRALAMTMPWLTGMGAVTVIVSKKREPRVNALVDYLGWHGIEANVELLDGRGKSVGEAMLNVCSDAGADFLIVGGFSHARARQVLFGGVTRHLFEKSNILTIMVH